MNKDYIYLDNAATTPIDPRVIKVIDKHLREDYGNPSSLHSLGLNAHKILEDSREVVGTLIKAEMEDIIFTGSGTEADNIAINGVAYKNKDRGNHIITSSIEHHAVLHPFQELEKQGFKVSYLPVDQYGLVDIEELNEIINDKTILISIMFANNEIGTIQPIKEIGEIANDSNIIFHTDAIQAFGKIPIDVNELKFDMLSASAHKLYGPKGVGMLFMRNKGKKEGWGKYCKPIMFGGGHERSYRPSTENIPSIAGFAKAVELAREEIQNENENKKLTNLRDRIISSITENIEDSYLNGHPTKRLPNNVNISFKYIEGESIILSLDMEGIAASTGSACSSKSLKASHVLLAIGLKPEEAHGSLRISLGRFNQESDVDYLFDVLPPIIERLRKMSPLNKDTKYNIKK